MVNERDDLLRKTVGSVMVVGGGIAGIQASLDLAESGFKVYLVEEASAIGGHMAQLDKTFPTNDCSMCIMSPKLVDCGKNLNIELLTLSEVKGVSGEKGNFTVTVAKHPKYVDWDKCVGCGVCAEKCPAKVSDEFNMGLSNRKAIYVKYPQAVPLKYAIDDKSCLRLSKDKKCGLCEKFCEAKAINFEQQEEEVDINVGSIIMASGFKPFDPHVYDTYGYGKYPNVVTSMEFERFLSASGPDEGHLLKPSNKKPPQKIAWLQCIGSRDQNRCDKKYCSSVCCTYAVKEAIIAKEHAHEELETTIFFMDMRTTGKDFERYYNRAQQEYGVRFVRSRIHTIDPIGDENDSLRLVFADEDGKIRQEEFDMIVLSVGLEPDRGAQELAQRVGIELNGHGFSQTSGFEPVNTSKEGVFVCGAMQGPKDIPSSVVEASAAACQTANMLASVRGTEVKIKEMPVEIDTVGQEPRIGVWVCHCGVNIAGVVDVEAVWDYAAGLPGVEYVGNSIYACSQDTQEKIKQIIAEKKLNRVVVASCTPRTHEPLFQNTCQEAGLNRYLFEMANVRDQCSWVHQGNREAATEKAKALVKSAVAKARLLQPLFELKADVTNRALVVGGGLSGMVASLSIANQGFEVELVEREPELGGHLRHVRFTADGGNPQEYLQSLIEKVTSHQMIKVHLESKVEDVSGHVGHFKSGVRCQVSGVKEIEHGVVVVATGGQELKPTEYLYGQDELVVTQRELEEHLANPHSAFRIPHCVVMIQCVGSRDEERPYCSRICCTQAVKNALKIKEKNPDTDVYILYRDMRTYGFNEYYYQQARQAGVIFVRYDVEKKPEVRSQKSEVQNQLEVEVFDPILQTNILLGADMVVLAPAVIPQSDNEILAKLLKIPINQDGFFLEAHAKLRPVDFATDGVFLCGLAHSPKSISESISQANAAACHAVIPLARGNVSVLPISPIIDEDKCIGCGLCVSLCSASAMELVLKEKGRRAQNIAAACKGCGVCGASCPQQAITIQHFTNEEIGAQIEALAGVV